jgi:hypothetical protein
MAWDIQINPTAASLQVTPALVNLIEPYLEDFEIRYAALEPDDGLIAKLKAYRSDGVEETRAVAQLIAQLEQGEPVELFLGH